jgi:hypothetical protein
LGRVDQHRNAVLVGDLDDVADGGQPSRHVRRRGDGEEPGTGRSNQGIADRLDVEGAIRLALDEPPSARPGPRKQVGVVLDHRGDHDVLGVEAEPVGQVVDRVGGVTADDRHVLTVRVSPRESQRRGPGLFVGGGG